MEVKTYKDIRPFLERTRAILEENEVVNSLMLGTWEQLLNNPPDNSVQPYLATVEDADGSRLIATMLPPYRIMLSQHRGNPIDNLTNLIENLIATGETISGAVGSQTLVDHFAALWGERHGKTYHPSVNMRLYELKEVQFPTTVPGEGRFATQDDLDLLVRWTIAFERDIHEEDGTSEDAIRQTAARRIAGGFFYLWCDGGQVVSMAAKARPTKHGMSVNSVYTPDELRGRGYASACVAALSQHILDEGKSFATLFTDLANPTSNSIYQKIGYRPVADFNEYNFK